MKHSRIGSGQDGYHCTTTGDDKCIRIVSLTCIHTSMYGRHRQSGHGKWSRHTPTHATQLCTSEIDTYVITSDC